MSKSQPKMNRKASLSEHERVFLHALLVDDGFAQHAPPKNEITDDVLFSVPAPLLSEPDLDSSSGAGLKDTSHRQRRQSSAQSDALQIGLWRAHEEGVRPALLKQVSQQVRRQSTPNVLPKPTFHDAVDEHIGEIIDTTTGVAEEPQVGGGSLRGAPRFQSVSKHTLHEEHEHDDGAPLKEEEEIGTQLKQPEEEEECSSKAIMSHVDEADTIRSDEEVRRAAAKLNAKDDDDDDKSENSSWGEQEGGFQHYDAWQVLKDEYAQDFGFSDHASSNEGTFKILGTSADDLSARPHVMSPPLLESLMNFVPEALSNQNLWLKYSLVRDGASLITLRELCHKSQYTFLAMETRDGDVLGSFTSTPWHKTTSYYGTGESFLWKMRHNRMVPCHSLLEQAEMESEVDIFLFSGLNYYIQLCTKEKLAVGGGSLLPGKDANQHTTEESYDILPSAALERLTRVTSDQDFGFGIAMNGDLTFGTTSPCATFRNPSLVHHTPKTETFEIVNVEVWTFTPCETVAEATIVEDMKHSRATTYRTTGSLTTSTSARSVDTLERQSIAELLRAGTGHQLSYRR